MASLTLTFADGDAATAALAQVRKGTLNWLIIGYADAAFKTLKLVSSGSGGLEECVAALDDGAIQYAIARVSDYIDGHETIKFVAFFWIGEGVKMIARAKVTTHRGFVESWLGQFHAHFLASEKSDLSSDKVLGKVADCSGGGSRVLEVGTGPRGVAQVGGARDASSKPSSSAAKELDLETHGAEISAALRSVRTGDADDAWCVCGYQGTTGVIVLLGQGVGGVENMKQLLGNETIAYGLVAVVDQIDVSTTKKFVLINFVGESVSSFRKAAIITHKGRIQEFIGQRHNEIDATHASDLSDELIISKVRAASGSANHVLDTVHATVPVRSGTSGPLSGGAGGGAPRNSAHRPGQDTKAAFGDSHVPTASSDVAWLDEAAKVAAIADVRSDASPTDWCLFTYVDATNKQAKVVGSGSGGLDELKGHLTSDGVYYGLLRVTDSVSDGVVDKTTKFVLVQFIGNGVKVFRRAKIVTHKGFWQAAIGQVHTDVDVSDASELTMELVRRRVGEASGTKSNVK